MRMIAYRLIKILIKAACYCYYKKIEMHGLRTLPKEGPLMVLPNHQNALLDALLIAAYSKRAPYFLTRSDVFTNALIRALFKLLRMLPIYRIRDGRDSLNKNHAIFDRCTELLGAGEVIVVFPEANHNSKRMVRPLSKGFTRILFQTLEKHPQLNIKLIPVGVNYIDLSGFPDSAAFYFGNDLELQVLNNSDDLRTAGMAIRQKVSDEIKCLTTHIGPEFIYEDVVAQLNRMQVNYLEPKQVNALIEDLPFDNLKVKEAKSSAVLKALWDVPFYILNAPVILAWRIITKPKVPEEEFMSTYRFLFSLMIFPIFYAVLLFIIGSRIGWPAAIASVLALFTFNVMYVKFR